MIETKVPKDIRNYETKIAGNFTVRQVMALVIDVAVCGVVYSSILKPLNLSSDMSVIVIVLISTIFIAFGWLKPYGMPFEQYLIRVIFREFRVPKWRKPTNKIYNTKPPKHEFTKKELKERKKLAKSNPEYIPYK